MTSRLSIIGRLTRGITANLFTQIILAGQNLLLVPLFLAEWGVKLYGDWLALSASVAYLSLFDIGMQNYVINLMTIHRTRQEDKQFHLVLHSAFLFYAVIIGIAMPLVMGLIWLVPWCNLMKLQVLELTTTRVILMFLSFQILVSIPSSILSGMYRSFNEYYRGQNINNILKLITLGMSSCVLIFNGGPIVLGGILAFQPFLTLMVTTFDIRRRHAEIDIGISRASWRLAVSFFMPSIFFSLFTLSNYLTFQGTSFILTVLLGSTSLVLFSITRTLANLIRQIFTAMNVSLWPEVTSLYAIGNLDRLRVLHFFACKYALMVSIASAIFVYSFAIPVFTLWTHQRVQPDLVLLGIFLISVVSESVWSTSGTFQVAISYHRNVAIRNLLSALSTVILSLFLVPFWGLRGAAVALLISGLLFVSIAVMRNTCRIIKESARFLLINLFIKFVPFTACAMFFAWGISYIIKATWCGLFTGAISYWILVLFICWIFLFDNDERAKVRSLTIRLTHLVVRC